jgi:DNA-directed RNA polymerase specialized sigma24 family protein
MAIPPLTCSTEDGEPYTRPAIVELQIEEALRHLPDDWGRTTACDWTEWRLGTFVHLIRLQARANSKAAYGRLVEEFLKRANRVIRKFSKGFSMADSEEIEIAVMTQIDDRLMAVTPTRVSDYLEANPYNSIQQITLREVAKRKHQPRPHQIDSMDDETSGAASEVAGMSDANSDPLKLLLASEEGDRRFRTALEAVTDPRHRKAFILHKLRRWPVKPSDPDKPSLVKEFGMSAGQIHSWIRTASRQIKEALGEE